MKPETEDLMLKLLASIDARLKSMEETATWQRNRIEGEEKKQAALRAGADFLHRS